MTARYGIIGFGRIGRRIAERLSGRDAPRLVGVLVRPAQAAFFREHIDPNLICTSISDMIARAPHIVVECASAAMLAMCAGNILASGIDLVPLSLAALADPAVEVAFRDAAAAGPGRVELAAGAMASLDFLATAREDFLASVTFRAIYPPARWFRTPAEDRIDLAHLDERKIFFRGTAREAAKLFPRHLNVCVGVALAGVGLDATVVELFADPALRQAAFEVDAIAAAGPIFVRVGPRDVAAGADPVDHTTFSVMRVLRRRGARIAI